MKGRDRRYSGFCGRAADLRLWVQSLDWQTSLGAVSRVMRDLEGHAHRETGIPVMVCTEITQALYLYLFLYL